MIGKIKEYADEFCGDLIDLMQEKYEFDINDIYFADDDSPRMGVFTNEFIRFCYTFARRRIAVQSSPTSARNQDEE